MAKDNRLFRGTGIIFSGLVALVLGCKAPQSRLLAVYPRTEPEMAVNFVLPKDSVLIPSDICYDRLSFDDEFEKAKAVVYKAEPLFSDHMQTPEKTVNLGTGDCEDKAIYLSKLLSEKEVYNEIIIGQIHKTDGFSCHVWNRVFDNEKWYLLDSVSGLKLLEKEVPSCLYTEYSKIIPTGYSKKDIRKYSIRSHFQSFGPMIDRVIFDRSGGRR